MARPKLLLADDSVTIRNVVEQTFTDEGFDVTTATTGEDALQKFAEMQPDIVILDVAMPEPTGYEICEQIKADETTRHIPVLLIVGSFEPFDKDEADRVGADGFLTKPFQSIRDLIVRVEELIGPRERSAVGETSDIDNLYNRSFTETNDEADAPLVEMLFGDAGMDDEIIEASHPSGDLSADDDFIIATKVGSVAERFNGVVDPTSMALDKTYEPSDEFIDLVAHRVIEKMSDKTVREIAKEAVPRIAEKLIREALKEEKK